MTKTSAVVAFKIRILEMVTKVTIMLLDIIIVNVRIITKSVYSLI